ncbi:MAG: NTP transferase domain-containing protein [Candidatus Pacebacteria bacterium]|nr:NTP transferase domain-containing protein [Candidatus Paceibacterota bacterium]
MQKTDVIILAGGYGKRMQSDLPKALVTLGGKALIEHVIGAVKGSGISENPIIVVGQKRDELMKALGDGYRFAVQEEQLGTGHAVMSAMSYVKDECESVLVLYADHPYVTSETIKKLSKLRKNEDATLVIATVQLPDFSGWYNVFQSFGRIKRNENGEVVGIVEAKDATEDEKKIQEVNPAYFCFEKKWLEESLSKIDNKNAQGEYYLTDLVKIAVSEKQKISTLKIEAREALGTNSKEDLEAVSSL